MNNNLKNWTSLFINLNGTMKKIGNVNPITKIISFYPEGYQYSDSPDLYYIDKKGILQQYNKE